MPFFPAEFFADTEHISDDSAHAYLFLLGHAWLRGAKLPNDQAALARMARMSPRRWAVIKSEVLTFWNLCADGFLRNRRLSKEYDFVCQKVDVNRRNGLLGGRPKSLENINDFKETGKPNGLCVETESNPPTPTLTSVIKEDSQNEPLSVSGKPTAKKRPRKRIEYPPDYDRFWKAYPTDANMSKSEGYVEWQKLDVDDRVAAEKSLPGFRAYCASHSDYRPIHANRYLSRRRFDGHLETSKKIADTAKIFVPRDSEPGDAWDEYLKRTTGKSAPRNRAGGWYFPSEYPDERYRE